MNTTTPTETRPAKQGKYTTWIKGSVLTEIGWKEGQVLDVLEGFSTKSEARKAGADALTSLKSETVSPSFYKIGIGY